MDLHYGTFPLVPGDLSWARQSAVYALEGTGLGVWAADGDEYFVAGGSDAVAVTITLTPRGDDVWVAVVVYSSNGTAERIRNTVRDLVQHSAPPPMPPLPGP